MVHSGFSVFFALFVLCFASDSQADQYSCAKMVYKDGWLTKYENLGNTWGANTKKHGVVSSSIGSSVEKSTSSVDPGVYTGQTMSSVQYSSSWGECSMVEMHITKQFRDDYIEQNMDDIKRQIAQGYGNHIDSLAFLSGCENIERRNWSEALQNQTSDFYEMTDSKVFSSKIDRLIQKSSTLSTSCSI